MTDQRTCTTEELLLRLLTGREHLATDEARRLIVEHRDKVLTEAADALEADARKGQQSGWLRIYKRQAVGFVRSLVSGAPEPEPVNEMAALIEAATEEILAAEQADTRPASEK